MVGTILRSLLEQVGGRKAAGLAESKIKCEPLTRQGEHWRVEVPMRSNFHCLELMDEET